MMVMQPAPTVPPAPVAYLRTALAFLVPGGTLLGALMILQMAGVIPSMAWVSHLRSHSHMQVFGFVVLFTMGIALLVVPRLTGAGAPPRRASWVPLALVAAGVLAAVAGWPRAAAVLEALGSAAFLVVVRLSAARSEAPRSRISRIHTLFTMSGGAWLVVGAAAGAVPVPPPWPLDTVLWGFASLYIMGVGLLIHPRILGLPEPSWKPLVVGLAAWNLGLLARALPGVPAWISPLLLVVGAVGYLAGLGPFRRAKPNPQAPPWLPLFIRTSYAWLVAATVAALATALAGSPPLLIGPVRHALAAGFVLTMIVGMAFRIVPNFCQRRLAWDAAPRLAWALLTLGTAVRVLAQALLPAGKTALAVGGITQFAAVLVFGFTLWVTLSRPLVTDFTEAPVRPGYPPGRWRT